MSDKFNKTYLGIELGSTRIKAVLLGEDFKPLASGSHTWENQFRNGYWTYSMDDVWAGLKDCYKDLKKQVSRTATRTLRSRLRSSTALPLQRLTHSVFQV